VQPARWLRVLTKLTQLTMAEAPSAQQAVLLPIDKLKKRCLDEFHSYPFDEYRLKGETESLKDFVGLIMNDEDEDAEDAPYQRTDGEDDGYRII
jgi:hypothetical protein